jgi:hypothetical protein
MSLALLASERSMRAAPLQAEYSRRPFHLQSVPAVSQA